MQLTGILSNDVARLSDFNGRVVENGVQVPIDGLGEMALECVVESQMQHVQHLTQPPR